jgi:hypothetical protein
LGHGQNITNAYAELYKQCDNDESWRKDPQVYEPPPTKDPSRDTDGDASARAMHVGDPSVFTEGSSRADAQPEASPDGAPWESKVTDDMVAAGCVLQCLNRILREYNLPEATAADLRTLGVVGILFHMIPTPAILILIRAGKVTDRLHV